jgi:hypothetical protein
VVELVGPQPLLARPPRLVLQVQHQVVRGHSTPPAGRARASWRRCRGPPAAPVRARTRDRPGVRHWPSGSESVRCWPRSRRPDHGPARRPSRSPRAGHGAVAEPPPTGRALGTSGTDRPGVAAAAQGFRRELGRPPNGSGSGASFAPERLRHNAVGPSRRRLAIMSHRSGSGRDQPGMATALMPSLAPR